MKSQVRERRVFDRLLFSTSWEDPAIDLEAFQIEADRDVVLSVTSGGDKVLSLLTASPRKIVTFDMNATQLHLLRLKMAGIRELDHASFLELLGVRPSTRRAELYRAARPHLTEDAAAFWDEHPTLLEKGVLTQGRFERYLGLFRLLLKGIEGDRRVRSAFDFDRLEDQRSFYFDEWNSLAWRGFFRIFFSRALMASLGLDPAFFQYVEERDFSKNFYLKTQRAFTDLPLKSNYFMAHILLGRYLDEEHVPPYLEKRHFELLRDRLDRIEIHHEEAEKLLATFSDGSIDKFDFTNIFEWIDESTFERLLRETVRVASPGAVLTYRNTLVPRSHPASLDDVLETDAELADRLHRQERCFFYSNLIVERVRA